VAELSLQGWPQSTIAEHLKVSQATVSADLNVIRKDWRESAIRDFDEARSIEIRKLDLIEREAWAAWTRSQKPQQSAVFTGDVPGPQSRKALTNRYGDPRFLEQVNKCIAQRRSLLGLDIAPIASSRDELFDGSLSLEVRRERVEAILTAISHRERTGDSGTGADGDQSGAVRAGNESGALEAGTPSGLPRPGSDAGA
jgi:hypothetical protein